MSPPPWCVPLHLRAVRQLWAAARALPAASGLQHRQGPQRRHGKPHLQQPTCLQGGAGLRHVSNLCLLCCTDTTELRFASESSLTAHFGKGCC